MIYFIKINQVQLVLSAPQPSHPTLFLDLKNDWVFLSKVSHKSININRCWKREWYDISKWRRWAKEIGYKSLFAFDNSRMHHPAAHPPKYKFSQPMSKSRLRLAIFVHILILKKVKRKNEEWSHVWWPRSWFETCHAADPADSANLSNWLEQASTSSSSRISARGEIMAGTVAHTASMFQPLIDISTW